MRHLRLIVTVGFLAARSAAPALSGGVALDVSATHPNGASLSIKSLEFHADSIVVSAAAVNPTNHDVALNKAHSLVLDDGGHALHRLNPPLDNPELMIPANGQLTGTLVFIGPATPAAQQMTLSSNQRVGTPDNPYDAAPVLQAKLNVAAPPPPDGAARASHPDGVTVLINRLEAKAGFCHLSMMATNGSDKTIVLNQNDGFGLVDDRGRAAPMTLPKGNSELVLPSGDRIDGDLIFDCRNLHLDGPLTLSTNRGTAGTADNPYDTVPQLTVHVTAQQSASSESATPASQVTVTPIARSDVSVETNSTSGAAPSAPPTSPAPRAGSRPTPPPPSAPAQPAPSPPAAALASPITSVIPRTIPQLETALRAAKTDRGLRIVLSADTLFGDTPDTLGAGAATPLAEAVTLIAGTHPRKISVAAHTDSVGADDDNLALSDRRAHVVSAWLTAHLGAHPPHIAEQGFGRTRPVAPNHNADGSDNPQGRAANRRIEITLGTGGDHLVPNSRSPASPSPGKM
jgi:outer membrane protein OmpA-like peptidoglycan-associated protein